MNIVHRLHQSSYKVYILNKEQTPFVIISPKHLSEEDFDQNSIELGAMQTFSLEEFVRMWEEDGVNPLEKSNNLLGPHQKQELENKHPKISVKLFGRLEIKVNDQLLDNWPSRRAKYLLAYLLLNYQRPQSRDMLIEKFWPHSTPETARNSLNVAIHCIRKVIKSVDPNTDYLIFKHENYAFHSDVTIESDVDCFYTNWRKGKHLSMHDIQDAVIYYEQAIAAYRGELMEENLYESWGENERNHLREAYLGILDQLSDYYFSEGELNRSIGLCECIIQVDNCREDIYKRMMEIYMHEGKRVQAIRQYYRCVETLEAELDISPTLDTQALFERIKEG